MELRNRDREYRGRSRRQPATDAVDRVSSGGLPVLGVGGVPHARDGVSKQANPSYV